MFEQVVVQKAFWISIDTLQNFFERDLSPGGGGYSLIRAEWGCAASLGMFFGIFVLNRVSILSIFVLNRLSF